MVVWWSTYLRGIGENGYMEFKREVDPRLDGDVGGNAERGYLPDEEAPPVNRDEIRMLVEGRLASEARDRTVQRCRDYRPWDTVLDEEITAYAERSLPAFQQRI